MTEKKVDSLFVPQYHDNVTGVCVGIMTVHKNGVIEWNQTTESPDTVVAYVNANYHKGGQRVRLDVTCKGEIPEWLGERYRYAMAHAIRKNRHELEKQFYIRRDEKIKGKIKRFSRIG